MRHKVGLLAATATMLGAAEPANAHVTLHPNSVPQGGFVQMAVRVPNERDNATTKKVDVKFPPGFLFASYQPVPGWSTKVRYAKLAEPVTQFGEKVTQRVDRVTWTTKGKGLAPGEFTDLPLSLAIPDKARGLLTFKALQTYSNGEIVRWIGAPDADTPAPQVFVADKNAAISDIPAGAGTAAKLGDPADPPAAVETTTDKSSSGASKALAWSALGIGITGVALAALALIRRRSA